MSIPIAKETALSQFALDVKEGLNKHPKELSSKYFYDQRGDKLFQDIMNMPEYYLTNSEFEIFERQKETIASIFGQRPFDLIELGAGDGTKTKILLQYFLEQGLDFQYEPVDISKNALLLLEADLKENLPNLIVNSQQGDYFEVLKDLKKDTSRSKVVLFLGANIGNFSKEQAQSFLQELANTLNPNDLVLIGFDLKKDPAVILEAYNDKAGITAAFNLNVLHRMNRELNANFDVDAFKHWESYDPITGATRSFIVSTAAQQVYIGALDETISFEAWEAIDVELSQKYSLSEIKKLANHSDFEIVEHLFDEQKYFVDTIWKRC